MAKLKRTAQYYATHPEARAKKAKYDKEHNRKPENRKKRSELVKINREKGTYGNGDGKDVSHTKNGVVMKKASVNRGSKTDSAGDKRARGKKVKRKAKK